MASRLKNLRLSGPRQFDAVFSGKKLVTGKLIFFFRPSAGSTGRLGIVAGKKTIPKAVDRNRFKRRIRDLRRRYANLLRKVDLVVLPRRGRAVSGFRALEACFAKCVRGMEY